MEKFQRIFISKVIIEKVNCSKASMDEAIEFQNTLNEDILRNSDDIIVDLSNCKKINSAFIGVLVITMKKLKAKKRKLILVEPADEDMKNDLILRGSYIAFEICENRSEAINSLKKDSKKESEQNMSSLSESNLALSLAG